MFRKTILWAWELRRRERMNWKHRGEKVAACFEGGRIRVGTYVCNIMVKKKFNHLPICLYLIIS